MIHIRRLQENENASAQHVEDVMMDYYKETLGRKDTVGMAAYMKEHLTEPEYKLWVQEGERAF